MCDNIYLIMVISVLVEVIFVFFTIVNKSLL